MAVLVGVVLIPGFLIEVDRVFVFVGFEFGFFGVGGVVYGGEFGEAFAGPFAGEERFELIDGCFHDIKVSAVGESDKDIGHIFSARSAWRMRVRVSRVRPR